ncbi:hypothetical protein FACS189434_08400 [Bacteroidia bacterium]|nr:hypothetical protein FACS189434_08400 [Bacteroidia bacterium]
MTLSQRDIVSVDFSLPGGAVKPHLAIVVSNDNLSKNTGVIYLALITSKDYNKEYCYPLTDDMLNFQLSKKSYVKCHILMAELDFNIFRKVGKMKKQYFDELQQKIIVSIF